MRFLTDRLRALYIRLRALIDPGAAEREIEEELRHHIALEADRLEREGLTPGEARRQALIRFGGVERYREETRDARRTRTLEDAMHDLKYALRMLRKNPLFSGVASLTLALGIGANTAIYTVVEALLLEPLPFDEPGELVTLHTANESEGQSGYMVSPLDFDDWRSQNRTFKGMAAFWPTAGTVTENDGNPTRVQVVYTTEDYFEVMGASALAGRTFRPDDGPGSTAVAILSEGFWERRFGGDPSVVGQTVTLDGSPLEIIGVLRGEHTYPTDADLWVNMTWGMQIQSRLARWMSAVGRLQDSERIDQARSDLNAIAARIAETNPDTNEGWTVEVDYLHEELVGETGTALWLLLASTGLVLLIACANVANLLLSRSEVRSREIAVRAAFGAGRGRLIRQLLTESMVLSAAGALVGIGLGWIGLRGLVAISPVTLPRSEAISMDGTVLLVVLGISVVTGLLFGLAPIARLIGSDLQTAIRDGARTTGSTHGNRMQSAFVVGQLSLALMLVAGAGLLLRSFSNLRSIDPGFTTTGVLTMELDLAPAVAPNDSSVIEFYRQLRERLAALPRVESVADASTLPLETDYDYVLPFEMDGLQLRPEQEARASLRQVSPGFFETFQTPLLEGRSLVREDVLGSRGVAVVNEAFVERFFPEGAPIGATLHGVANRFGPLGALLIDEAEVVGVVADIRYHGLREPSPPAIYFSGLQSSIRRRALVIRTAGDPTALVPRVREELSALSGRVAMTKVQTMDEVIAEARARDRFSTLLLSLFGLVALSLAAIGVYGVLAYAVARRTREMGIRMALGAGRGDVRRMVLGQGLRLVGVGLGIGLVGALALSGFLATQLYQVDPRDPSVLLSVGGVLLGVGVLASLIPAWRATRVDPVVAMRGE